MSELTDLLLDASVLINLLHVRRLDLLTVTGHFRPVVPEDVLEEIRLPDQRAVLVAELRPRDALLDARPVGPVELPLLADGPQQREGDSLCSEDGLEEPPTGFASEVDRSTLDDGVNVEEVPRPRGRVPRSVYLASRRG